MANSDSIRRSTAACAAAALIVLGCSAVQAESWLIDLGNDASYRGASTPSADANGNYWTSVWSGAFYQDLPNSDGVTTAVDFGFTTPGGTDSYNGPAGATDGGQPPSNSVYDAAALGDLGVDEAVYDFYTNSTFQIQELQVGGLYDLTFFGSHKYNGNNTTRYTVYTDASFTTPVASVDLVVGVDDLHNQDTVATLSGVSPAADGILYVGFGGAGGGEGYLNAIQLTAVPEPASLALLAALCAPIWPARRR
ncbi:hypothetical protein Pla123a_19060 [Posidoniimonas polymericola]|uniref:PEP-CTERM protein-sorting domain-containing protein n=1 Tax=Posidoniimonas polymericola TaxID=2528002 RepID=A0A5C5YQW8_9BACT|nr:hypothetical protein [Posidoniimonas polymericola]TWT77249.1 hypothetical protein Pla123a_19060 [Posidoniimonas polymericola]